MRQMWVAATAVAIAAASIANLPFSNAYGAEQLSESQLVELAVEVNPQVKAARARLGSALHSIKQTVAPNDPIFTYTNSDSPKNPFGRASLQEFNVSESFAFPGKALLHRDQAERSAEIARLVLTATVRDVRAAAEAAYYQLLLDSALGAVNAENVENLSRVVRVAQVAYSTSKVTQTDYISAEFDLATARQLQLQYQTALANDQTALNLVLARPPGSPLSVDQALKFEPLKVALDAMIDRASAMRQEILEAALAERNSNTALNLAKMEYLPDFTVAYQFDNYLVPSFAPKFSQTQDHSLVVGFNVPIFFWLKQNEDVAKARADLEASHYDLATIRNQTAAAVATLIRNAQFAYQSSTLYRDSLIPLAHQDFEVALVAYQSGKIDFVTLAGALRRNYDARVSYLQAANQFLAGRIALELAIGAPLPQ
ncbi:MAG: putative heavy metal efflux pump protein CzcC [Candidatus Binatus sp.]|nr:putative heavy metal efflux pump protein CzcC [Candidatus Binatus sp.]